MNKGNSENTKLQSDTFFNALDFSNQKLGSNIKEYRTKQGITQEQLGLCLNITGQAVSKWERGDSWPDPELIPKIAQYLKVTPNDLYGFDLNKVQNEMNKQLREAIDSANQKMKSNPNTYIEELEKWYIQFPDNEELLDTLLKMYTYVLTEHKSTQFLDITEERADYVMHNSTSLEYQCDAILALSAVYEARGEIDLAIMTLQKLPKSGSIKYDSLYSKLNGGTQIEVAQRAKMMHSEAFFKALLAEGDAWLKMSTIVNDPKRAITNEYLKRIKEHRTNSENLNFFAAIAREAMDEMSCVTSALKIYQHGYNILQCFFSQPYTSEFKHNPYASLCGWVQDFHWKILLRFAACARISKDELCELRVQEAFNICTYMPSCTKDNTQLELDACIANFNQELKELELDEFIDKFDM